MSFILRTTGSYPTQYLSRKGLVAELDDAETYPTREAALTAKETYKYYGGEQSLKVEDLDRWVDDNKPPEVKVRVVKGQGR